MLCLSLSRPKGTARQGWRGPLWARPLIWQGSTADSNKTAQPQESGGRVRAAGSRSQKREPGIAFCRTLIRCGLRFHRVRKRHPLIRGTFAPCPFLLAVRFDTVVTGCLVQGGWRRGRVKPRRRGRRIGPRTTILGGEQTTGRGRGGGTPRHGDAKAAAGGLTWPSRGWAIVDSEGGDPAMGESTPAGAAGGPEWRAGAAASHGGRAGRAAEPTRPAGAAARMTEEVALVR